MTASSLPEEARAALDEAQRAETATLWDVAAERYESFLSLIDGAEMAADEVAALTALGRCYRNLSDARTAWRTLRRAIGLYRERGDGVGMATATLEILRIWGPPDRQHAMAAEALEQLGDGEPHLRALLLLRDWQHEEALALADQHGFADVLIFRVERSGWETFDNGNVAEAIATFRQVHEFHASQYNYHAAAGVLRGAGFRTLEFGLLDDGEALSQEALAYARTVHLHFSEQLALMDLVGIAFARCDFERCLSLIDEMPTATDFRGDLYRMWIAELRGDMEAALSLMVDPERGGGATTALSQTHAAAAGVLFHAGREDAARRELETWADIARQGGSFCEEAPVLADCLVGVGSDALVRELHHAFEKRTGSMCYATLQGRGDGYVRGAIALRLGMTAAARARFEAGLGWAKREHCPIDAGCCLLGLASVAAAEDDRDAINSLLDRAATKFEGYGANMYLGRLAALRRG